MKKLLLGILLASSAWPVLAETAATPSGLPTPWVSGISFVSLAETGVDLDRDVHAFVATLGYRIKLADHVYAIPDIRLGKGAGDDSATVEGTDIDITFDNFIALTLRGQFELDNGAFAFVAPSIANVGFSISSSQEEHPKPAVDDSWELGVGVGAGYRYTQNMSAELTLERFDDTEITSFGLRFYF